MSKYGSSTSAYSFGSSESRTGDGNLALLYRLCSFDLIVSTTLVNVVRSC